MTKAAPLQTGHTLDRIDRKLISLLQREGRLSNADLAKAVHLTPTPCLRRVRELENSQLIRGYKAVVDRRKVGFGLRAFVGITRDRDVEPHEMWKRIEVFPEIIGCYVVSGEFDLLLDIVAEDLDTYSNVLIEKLLSIPGVKQTRSIFVLREIRSEAPLPIEALRSL
ncbi:Lrp/AsnC family transcriptional regulator [Burkholderia sp. MR1-5-21]